MRIKLSWILSVAAFALLIAVGAVAGEIPANDKAKENANPNNPAINDWQLTPPGLEKIVFIHYKKDFGRPSGCNNDGKCQGWESAGCADCVGGGNGNGESKCYDFLGKEVKWSELPVSYVVDPDNPDGLSESFVTSAILNSAEEWDNHTIKELFDNSYTVDYNSSWDSDAPDGRNELVFDSYSDPNAIAVTVVWGYFTGPPKSRRIIEFDTLFNTDFVWGDAAVDPSKMDLQNIATHELGHGIGLDDLYDSACAEQTMYGYSDYGEIAKRALEKGDIAGLTKLYGN